jgi:biotin operon repressor
MLGIANEICHQQILKRIQQLKSEGINVKKDSFGPLDK